MESKVRLIEYFDIVAPIQDDKINFELSDISEPEAVPFLGRAGTNNGIVDYVTPKKNKINQGGVISIALDGSTGSTFYQHSDFISGQNIWILKPKKNKFDRFGILVALYCITSIRKSVSNYSFNLSLTKTRLKEISILLDINRENAKANVDSMEQRMKTLRNIEILDSINKNRIT